MTRHLSADLLIGHVLPDDASVASVTLNGAPFAYHLRLTARGTDVVVDAGPGAGKSTLVVTLA